MPLLAVNLTPPTSGVSSEKRRRGEKSEGGDERRWETGDGRWETEGRRRESGDQRDRVRKEIVGGRLLAGDWWRESGGGRWEIRNEWQET